jgi:hypothetical protein
MNKDPQLLLALGQVMQLASNAIDLAKSAGQDTKKLAYQLDTIAVTPDGIAAVVEYVRFLDETSCK